MVGWSCDVLNLVSVQMRASSGFRLVCKPSRQHHRGLQLAIASLLDNAIEGISHNFTGDKYLLKLIRKETSKQLVYGIILQRFTIKYTSYPDSG